jgi:hypothetical protein
VTGFLSADELERLTPSDLLDRRTPLPTQIVSSDEYFPAPQSDRQREAEERLLPMADALGGRQGLDRRRFFQTAAGTAPAAHSILQSADRVLRLAGNLVGLPSVSSFLSPKVFPAASFTVPLICSAEPLTRSLSIAVFSFLMLPGSTVRSMDRSDSVKCAGVLMRREI